MVNTVVLDAEGLSLEAVEAVARGGASVRVSEAAGGRMRESRAVVEACLGDGEAHYGINTGFGSLSRRRIGAGDLADLQRNLVRSHSAGVGANLPRDVVRGMMLLLAASLCRGVSGARPVIAETLASMLNAGITPAVPEVGSVGASGDLAPLAHCALGCIGEGMVLTEGGVEPAGEAMGRAGIAPLVLEAKEGLAMINGTHLMAAQGALLCVDAERLFDAAVMAAGMSIDACRATDAFLDERVYEVRGQPGPRRVAESMRGWLAGSEVLVSHRENDPRVQDPYSFRCSAMVLGSALDAIDYVKQAIGRELSAVTDNPLVFPGAGGVGEAVGSIVSAGNFHGMPLAIPLDVMTISLSHIAGIAERRVFWMLSAVEKESELPHYLTPIPALNSGLMIAQYTAAACCNEIIGLANPASVANISTSAGIEDYNSFGPRSAAKARRAMELATNVVGIELLCAAQGIEYHRPLKTGQMLERVHAQIRAVVPKLEGDRPLAPDIARLAELVASAALLPR
ncbi:MAG: histidine ammonia-lyase [Phycisphaerales bacterium]|nr:histidine ammonia-lyase [Phycisphaerales bacterium]